MQFRAVFHFTLEYLASFAFQLTLVWLSGLPDRPPGLPTGSGAFPGGGDDGIRTHDPLLAGQVLSQLSYTPVSFSLRCYGRISSSLYFVS